MQQQFAQLYAFLNLKVYRFLQLQFTQLYAFFLPNNYYRLTLVNACNGVCFIIRMSDIKLNISMPIICDILHNFQTV